MLSQGISSMPLSFHLRLIAVQFTIAFLLSGAITLINQGFGPEFGVQWGKAFLLTFLLVPIVVQLIPRVKALLARVFRQTNPGTGFKCLTACCVALMMESIIALALTALQFGLSSDFFARWAWAVVMALPLGITIGLVMVFRVEPVIQALGAEGKRQQQLARSKVS